MKKSILAFGLSLATVAAFAQIGSWKVSEVTVNKEPVGYIYHTEANGVSESRPQDNTVAGLRLVCSKIVPQKGPNEIIGIHWQTMTGYEAQYLTITIDGNKVGLGEPLRWEHEGQFLYRGLNESRTLLQSMKTGRSMSVRWIGSDAAYRNVTFDLRGFNSQLSDFNKKCNINL
jgi:hypothetical protein